MSIFRRDKDDDKQSMEEYRRSREAFKRIRPGDEPDAYTSTARDSRLPEIEDWAYDEPTSKREPETKEDSLEKYREGATTVAKDTSFNGTLKTEGNLYIEGNFDGQLEAHSTIFIAESANVKAELRATDVIIAGTLDGTVDADDRFHAMPSSRVTGEINSRVLVVEQGSHINCRFAMKQRGRHDGS
ncbi:MAG: bactofilin family protein [Ardenticatenaceae bacterium]